MDLTLDYGTVAVSFPNGTVVAVARVEGSWLFAVFSILMLHTLKASAEAFLDGNTRVTAAGITVPRSLSSLDSYYEQVLRKAAENVGLEARPAFDMAAEIASYMYSKGLDISPLLLDDQVAVLAVDYSRQSFMAVLFLVDEFGLLKTVRIDQSFDLGHHFLRPGPEHWTEIRQRLQTVVSQTTEISQLILLGDRAKNQTFIRTVQEALAGYYTAQNDGLQGNQESEDFDPVFIAAKEAARLSARLLDHDWGLSSSVLLFPA
ncbi:hypothetical protein T310_1483 [Rasamsonia emersonii CBS 393.64]|uniref:Uncharacterized protein n=1 Tax=Rasamsonia emersonii (strain ATCC 16479 / CBS 393.64 / IMI 116815) TaxID=1408163 RepID=A0A0F4Z1S1_RASE3|nr:hypothetical protein T310_1483 [Rasamsonia emersonii CBS 393.64]KKA24454.1 hypothetical protein T310_1483 [Rasamsonia emersonii CBS 393.64]